MAENPILVPKMGESISEATVIRWLKNVGERVEKDEPIVEIATDKVDNEIPSPSEGVLTQQLFQDGDVVKVGEAIAMIDGNGEAVEEAPNTPESKEPITQSPVEEIENQISEAAELAKPVANNIVSKPENSNRFYSPLVMSIASQEGIPSNELETITGTGLEGRVTKADILKYIKNRGNAVPATSETSESVTSKASFTPEKSMVVSEKPAIPVGQGDEIIQMDRVRKMIADHMVMSMQTSPHVTSFVEADVTNLVNWRNKIKKGFKEREGQNLTFTPIFIWALAKTIKEFPMINVSVDGDKIIKKRDINMGMAVAQKNGNLIVPVIRQADSMNLLGLTRAVNDLALRARENKLSPDEIQGGTYTLTNVGSFGNIAGTPVINQPQVAIMAVGTITKKPSVLETDQGDVIAIRHKMILSHSYDHRVVDGALGGMFVKRVAEHLENWDMNTEV
ncbi:MAG: dihydrolipoamide acetyltransferase family protein [Bacteroidia bacterium]|jgi:2-oxoglutarate dehydrogenase E2 component (dihydrolipoamide succinyltransferase)